MSKDMAEETKRVNKTGRRANGLLRRSNLPATPAYEKRRRAPWFCHYTLRFSHAVLGRDLRWIQNPQEKCGPRCRSRERRTALPEEEKLESQNWRANLFRERPAIPPFVRRPRDPKAGRTQLR
jgi:hypothetical protein